MLHDSVLARVAQSAERNDVLRELAILDTNPEPEFDAITQAAARLLGCSISLVSLIDTDRQWFKSRHNISIAETPIEWSFCRFAVERDEILVVEDATQDLQFANNPLVVPGGAEFRFYAGVPIRLRRNAEGDSVALGTLCVIDHQPQKPTAEALDALIKLARLTEMLLTARLNANKVQRQATALASAMTEKTRLHRQLHQAERMAGIGSWRLCLEENTVEWSPQVYAIHGLSPNDPIPVSTALDFFPGDNRRQISNAISRCIRSGQSYDLELDFITAKGDKRRVRAIGELELKNGKPEALIGVFQDITERNVLEQKLRDAADTDYLTQLASRRRFEREFDHIMFECVRDDRDLALVLIDLDHFKAINDTQGHAAGDKVLREVARRLRAPWLQQSFAARLGGDEFVLVLSDEQLLGDLDATMSHLLRELRLSFTDEASDDISYSLSATMGIAMLDRAQPSRTQMLKNADDALYHAKRHGRGTACLEGAPIS
ncbi:hypothetical protein GCM10009127_11040 [Alteraurantiacibacter aestuarii]|uniref:Diguanylate cyclase n=1 Tax=Alteraurantiacibacter aestuarii TaxID=650004 RepID=A0A844ZJP1_9SPHN|nr:diguanylate cyclase [Alteraurantiacibacter aestuarii]MXO87492.1 diguanylate cyclase [Alteraurantiacibacter aestuarii]